MKAGGEGRKQDGSTKQGFGCHKGYPAGHYRWRAFCYGEGGIAKLTTKLVSKRAGVSTASIHYFFDTKDALIYQAFAYMVRSLREETIAIRRSEADPLMRIARSLEVHFSPFHFMADISIIWPQFWAYSGADESVARLMHIFSIRMISNSMADLRALGYSRADARLKAIELSALQRGLWIERR